MRKLYFLLFTFLITSASFGQTSDLLFSMYAEGSSNNKFLEIYNGTGSAVDLGDYSISSCSNGCDVVNEFDFPDNITWPASTMIADGDVYVIAHGSADAAILAQADMTFSFLSNGDDAFALTLTGATASTYTIIDILGDLQGDPGTGWDVAGVTNGTSEHTLTRKTSICDPNATPLGSFGTDADDSEWIVTAQNSEWANLGMYTGCVSDPVLTITSPADNQEFSYGTTNVNVSVAVQNFDVANGTGDGHIHWTLDGGGTMMKYDTLDEPITVSDGNSYTVYMELVDNSHVAISPAVNATVNFSVANPPPSLPIYEGFDYANAENLGDQTNWENLNSGDEITVSTGNLSYSGLPSSTGNLVSYAGAGMDPTFEFSSITSGTVYASFIFKVTDHTSITDLTDGGYFAGLSESTFSYDARIWVRPNPDASPGTTFDVGFGNVSSNPPFTPSTYNVGDDIFAVISYDIDTGDVNAWINPSSGDFGGSAPAATLSSTDGSPASSINRFILRQDSTGETPSMQFDELRIGTSWNDVTSAPLSVNDFKTNHLLVYPNPSSLGYINVYSERSGSINATIFDLLGKQVMTGEINNNRLDVSRLNTGVYMMNLSQNNATITKKLVIQ